MDYRELIAKAKEIDEQATPGPWMWDLRECNHFCLLTTTHSGRYYVMGFQRWGMQDAVPVFQVYERYEGPVHKRGSKGMVRADKLSKSYPGQEHHHGFDNYISHPDARYIAEGRELFHQLIEACAELQARAEKAEKQRDDLFKTLVDVCKDVRETHGDDSVCGLCEYDGAYIGESGDWHGECPGFETDRCFCMKESYCKEWGQPFKPYAENAQNGESEMPR